MNLIFPKNADRSRVGGSESIQFARMDLLKMACSENFIPENNKNTASARMNIGCHSDSASKIP